MTELEVDIYGKKYTLRGESVESIKAVAGYVDRRLKELFGAEPRAIDQAKALVLAINFAEEIHNLKQAARRESEELNQKLEKLALQINRLEKLAEL
jgi:cell division protein ZapA